jgi:hypothetical protein
MKLPQRKIKINKTEIECYGCCYFLLEGNKLKMRNYFGPVDHVFPDGSIHKTLTSKQIKELKNGKV